MSHPLSRLDRRLAILGEQIANQQRETISTERFERDDHQPDGTVRPPKTTAAAAVAAVQPPLGVKPRHIWLAERCKELASAIARFPDGHAIKVEMEQELDEHVRTLLKHETRGTQVRLQSPPPAVIAGSMQVIKDALLQDEGYAIGWHANLVMAIKDAHESSWARDVSAPDIAADLILQRIFGLPSNPDRCQMLGTKPRDHGPMVADVNAQMELERIEPYSVLQQRRQQAMQERLNQDAADAFFYLSTNGPR